MRNKILDYAIHFKKLRPRWNGQHFADAIFKCNFLYENTSISINISLKCVPEGRINNIPSLVQIMAWRRLGDKPLSEPIMVSLLTHICVTQPQCVNDAVYQLRLKVFRNLCEWSWIAFKGCWLRMCISMPIFTFTHIGNLDIEYLYINWFIDMGKSKWFTDICKSDDFPI